MTDGSSFRDKLRVRVCGLLIKDDAILLAQIHSPVVDDLVWTPPGGGLQFGEHLKDCLEREFAEETNLKVVVQDLVHINELVEDPYHAVEFYFEVTNTTGEPKKGRDPELSWDQQLLHDLKWVPLNQLEEISFAPENLLSKIKNWERRSTFDVF